MSDVFISYKAEDRTRVGRLVDSLRADGVAVWWDANIEAGASWRQSIQQGLDTARCVLVVWSARSIGPEGHFVHDEATRGQRRGIYLPVRIDPVEPPIGFGEVQAMDLIRWKGIRSDPRYQAVLAAVRAMLAGEKRASGPARPQPPLVGRRALIGGGATAAAAALAGGAWLGWPGLGNADANAIAVMPFENLSGDPAQAYFSQGMSEELRDSLARIDGLQVAARTSSERAGNDRDAVAIASHLGVRYVLDGSVRRGGDLIRVSAQLVDGRSGLNRWSQSYNQPAGDALSIQSDIAMQIADALKISLGAGGAAALQVGESNNAEAREEYLKGLALLRKLGDESDYRSAQSHFEAAVALDPAYAQAHAKLAQTLAAVATDFMNSDAAGSTIDAALASARRAVQLAPALASAYQVLGNAYSAQLHMREAAVPFAQARKLGAGDADILSDFAQYRARTGRGSEAKAEIGRAVGLDPLNPRPRAIQGAIYRTLGDPSGAVGAYRKVLMLNAASPYVHWSIGDCYYELGDLDRASAEYALEKVGWARATGEAMVAWKRGDKAAAARALAILQADGGADYQIAEVLAQRGDISGALDALERAYRVRDTGLVSLKSAPMLAPLRTEPRYHQLLRDIGLE